MTALRSNLTSIGVGPAAGSSQLSYITSMNAFEVRQMTGAYAPTNGNELMTAVTPAEWNPGSSNQGFNDWILYPWSGGAKMVSATERRIWVHGGGHDDSANNGVYLYDFGGNAQPTGWVLKEISAVADVPLDNAVAYQQYSDLRPASVHAYGGQCYMNGLIWRAGGSPWRYGTAGTPAFWKYDLNGAGATVGGWSRMSDISHSLSGAMIGLEPNASFPSGKLLIFWDSWSAGGRQYLFYRPDTDSWTGSLGSFSTLTPGYASIAHRPDANDETLGKVLLIGDTSLGPPMQTFDVDWANETVTNQTVISGSTSGAGPLVFYDAGRDSFWATNGGSNDTQSYATLREYDAVTLAEKSGSPHTLAGISSEAPQKGDFGRSLFMSDVRALCIVPSRFVAPYVIKLPN